MQPQQKREPTTFRSAGPATRREIHNNVVQWRAQALADRRRRVEPVEHLDKPLVSPRVENLTLGIVAIAAFLLLVGRMVGVL